MSKFAMYRLPASARFTRNDIAAAYSAIKAFGLPVPVFDQLTARKNVTKMNKPLLKQQ